MPFLSRKSPRIPEYDYATENYYFVTVCTYNRKCIFGKPGDVNALGKIAQDHIQQISEHFLNVRVDKYVVMPNHIHMIVAFVGKTDVRLTDVVGLYKSGVTRQIHQVDPLAKIWQRSFHDRIIRNQREYEKIWLYIHGNPGKWDEDCYNNEPV